MTERGEEREGEGGFHLALLFFFFFGAGAAEP